MLQSNIKSNIQFCLQCHIQSEFCNECLYVRFYYGNECLYMLSHSKPKNNNNKAIEKKRKKENLITIFVFSSKKLPDGRRLVIHNERFIKRGLVVINSRKLVDMFSFS